MSLKRKECFFSIVLRFIEIGLFQEKSSKNFSLARLWKLHSKMRCVSACSRYQWMNKDLRHNVYRFHSLIMVSRSQFRSVSDAFGEFAWR